MEFIIKKKLLNCNFEDIISMFEEKKLQLMNDIYSLKYWFEGIYDLFLNTAFEDRVIIFYFDFLKQFET